MADVGNLVYQTHLKGFGKEDTLQIEDITESSNKKQKDESSKAGQVFLKKLSEHMNAWKADFPSGKMESLMRGKSGNCLLYTSDAADE